MSSLASCTQTVGHSGCCGIIPEYMLRKLAEKEGDNQIKEIALNTLGKDDRVRKERYQVQKEFHRRTFVPYNLSEISDSQTSVIKIYDAKRSTQLPGTKIVSPDLSTDKAVVDIYRWAVKTDEFFRNIFERNSIDNNGMEVVSTVHYDRNYANAFWNGSQMVFGDGDGKYIASFTIDSDIYAHEYMHGVSQFDTNLRYQDQAGALNESISDVFGIMAKQSIQKETVDSSNWLIGEHLLVGGKYALRSMKNPGTAYRDHPVFGDDPQTASMDAYDDTLDDNGGVHINSGIPNKAFYLASTKLRDYDHERYAYTWNGTGRVWYEARQRVGSHPTFSDFASKTVEVAQELFGRESNVEKACRYAWGDVKVELGSTPSPAPKPIEWCNLL